MKLFASVLLFLLPLSIQAQTLYNETAGTLPASQGWLTYITDSTTNATQTYIANQGVQLVTTSPARAGYFNKNPIFGTPVNPAFPTLNRNTGFAIQFDLLVSSEIHTNTDRAGFSIIALASDSRGIELGFWNNEVWAQNDDTSSIFTHGEGVGFSTTARTSYQLTLLGNQYNLAANGTSILTGNLRNYTTFGIPYTNNNFLFLGDDTTSADADITLGRVALLTAIPEPMTWLMIACVFFGVGCWYYRWRETKVDAASCRVGDDESHLD